MEDLRSDVRALLEEFPAGLNFKQLQNLYKSKYGRSIDPRKYSLSTLNALMVALAPTVVLQYVGKGPGSLVAKLGTNHPSLSLESGLEEKVSLEKSFEQVQDEIVSLLKRFPEGLSFRQLSVQYEGVYGCPLQPSDFGFESLRHLLGSCSRGLRLKRKNWKKNSGGYLVIPDQEELDMENQETPLDDPAASRKPGVLSPELRKLQGELVEMLADFSDGLNFRRLRAEYRSRFGRALNPLDFGHVELYDLLVALSPEIRTVMRNTKDKYSTRVYRGEAPFQESKLSEDKGAPREISGGDCASASSAAPATRPVAPEQIEELRARIDEALRERPDGIYLCDLPVVFLEKWGVVLDTVHFGYHNMAALLTEGLCTPIRTEIRGRRRKYFLPGANVTSCPGWRIGAKAQLPASVMTYEDAPPPPGSDRAAILHWRMRKLLALHPDGLSMQRFPSRFEALFSVPFKAQDYGFTTLKSLLLQFPDLLTIGRNRSDELLVLPRSSSSPSTHLACHLAFDSPSPNSTPSCFRDSDGSSIVPARTPLVGLSRGARHVASWHISAPFLSSAGLHVLLLYEEAASGWDAAIRWLCSDPHSVRKHVLGLDVETDVDHHACVLQLSYASRCVILRLRRSRLPARRFPPSLLHLLDDLDIYKVGAAIEGDVINLLVDHGLLVRPFVNLNLPFSDSAARAPPSLKEMFRTATGCHWVKDRAITKSDWAATSLSLSQVKYAALDAWASWRCAVALLHEPSSFPLGEYTGLDTVPQPATPSRLAEHAVDTCRALGHQAWKLWRDLFHRPYGRPSTRRAQMHLNKSEPEPGSESDVFHCLHGRSSTRRALTKAPRRRPWGRARKLADGTGTAPSSQAPTPAPTQTDGVRHKCATDGESGDVPRSGGGGVGSSHVQRAGGGDSLRMPASAPRPEAIHPTNPTNNFGRQFRGDRQRQTAAAHGDVVRPGMPRPLLPPSSSLDQVSDRYTCAEVGSGDFGLQSDGSERGGGSLRMTSPAEEPEAAEVDRDIGSSEHVHSRCGGAVDARPCGIGSQSGWGGVSLWMTSPAEEPEAAEVGRDLDGSEDIHWQRGGAVDARPCGVGSQGGWGGGSLQMPSPAEDPEEPDAADDDPLLDTSQDFQPRRTGEPLPAPARTPEEVFEGVASEASQASVNVLRSPSPHGRGVGINDLPKSKRAVAHPSSMVPGPSSHATSDSQRRPSGSRRQTPTPAPTQPLSAGNSTLDFEAPGPSSGAGRVAHSDGATHRQQVEQAWMRILRVSLSDPRHTKLKLGPAVRSLLLDKPSRAALASVRLGTLTNPLPVGLSYIFSEFSRPPYLDLLKNATRSLPDDTQILLVCPKTPDTSTALRPSQLSLAPFVFVSIVTAKQVQNLPEQPQAFPSLTSSFPIHTNTTSPVDATLSTAALGCILCPHVLTLPDLMPLLLLPHLDLDSKPLLLIGPDPRTSHFSPETVAAAAMRSSVCAFWEL